MQIPPGAYCITEPLSVSSDTEVVGAGSGVDPATNTIVTQVSSATSGFTMVGISNSTLTGVRVVLSFDLATAPPGSTCTRNPLDSDKCMWRRGSGVAMYGVSNVTVANCAFVGGANGIALLDHSQIDEPAGGPHAQVVVGDDGRPEVWNDACSSRADNVDVQVLGNQITGAQNGILILNLGGGSVRGNTVRGSKVFNGIKVGCGPVVGNRIVANYLSGNGVGGVGDGIDVAWAWSESDESWGWSIEDPPDGEFRWNTIQSNLIWGNVANGIAIKSSQYTSPTPKRGVTAYFCGAPGNYDLTTTMRLANNQVSGNAVWDNGASQIELRRYAPVEGCFSALPYDERPAVYDNVVWGATTTSNGIALGHVRNITVHENWAQGSRAGSNAHDIYFFSGKINYVYMSADFADAEDIAAVAGVTFGPGKRVEGLFETLQEPTVSARDPMLGAILRADPIHCADDDGDGCPNACEALSGTDHLDAADVPDVCTCPDDACT